MAPVYALLVVVVAACPAPPGELMTRQRAHVRESASPTSRVLAELPANLRVQSSERKDFWFRISADIGGTHVEGWVNQTDVTAMMGRSKGQLIEENDRLYAELVSLREAKLVLEKQADAAREAIRRAEDEAVTVKQQLSQTRAELAEAMKTIERLRAALKPQGKVDD